ncbi:leishmanolysin-like peptidase 2 [Anneissia japonica]|uniref:leishmanolysin-like peptidase 2 n=1 Tax=Anneissia japonica TaxID=1529436 RepID=UPI001425528A|nr:leishmanolysin-like peptidase 2 [Anneissia japonica]XP_033104969.1 leishmanolysin-like peptidase 2 [Anneissia japonica]
MMLKYTMRFAFWLKCIIAILMMVGSYQMETSESVHRCIHDEVQSLQIQRIIINYADFLRDKRSVTSLYKPLRIMPYYYDLSNLESDNQEKVKIIVKKAVNVIQHVLSVIPVSGPLLFSRTHENYCKGILSIDGPNNGKCSRANTVIIPEKCKDVQIPDDHLEGAWLWNSTHPEPIRVIKTQGGGIANTDIVIYVQTQFCDSEGVLAHAQFCRVDQNGRPVAGFMNLCPHSFHDFTDVDKLTTVTIHEIFHILGFTHRLYDEFRDCSSSATGLDCPKRENTMVVDNKGQSVLLTPTVMLKAREHFNCFQNGFGSLLENQESKSHWEMRMMAGSIMAPVITQAHVTFLDPITLAVFEDTGWYKANFEYAQSMPWGRNAGCAFGLLDTCSDPPYFCSNESISGCHYLHGDKGSCSSNEYLESCSLFTVIDHGLCSEESNSHFSEELQQTGELYGTGSKCFVTDLRNDTFIGDESKGHCYKTRCDWEEDTYEILVAGIEWHRCYSNDTVLIAGYSREVHCPPFEVICQNRSSISNLFSLPDLPEASTIHPTTEHQDSDLPSSYNDNLVIEIAFDDMNASHTRDEDGDVDLLHAVNQRILSITNVSQDRLDVFELEVTIDCVFVILSIQHSTPECKISSYNVYKSLEEVVKSNKFTIVHHGQNLTATTIRIIDTLSWATSTISPTELTGVTLAVVIMFSIIGAIVLIVVVCLCKRKACSQRVAPLDITDIGQPPKVNIKMQSRQTTRKKNPKI